MKVTSQFTDKWLRAAARVLEPWLRGLLARLEKARSEPIAPSAEARNSAKNGGVAPVGTGGPPADWLEKVRRGAPHLLRPLPQPGAPASGVKARVSRLAPLPRSVPPPVPVVLSEDRRAARETAVVEEHASRSPGVSRAEQTSGMRAPRLLSPPRSEATTNSAKASPSLDMTEQITTSAARRVSVEQILPQAPTPEPAPLGYSPSPGEAKDRWPALPPKPTPDPLEAVPVFWRETERRRYLIQEQEGTYGPRRFSRRG